MGLPEVLGEVQCLCLCNGSFYPQLGITGTFSSNSRINLIPTSSGSNQVPDPTGILVRVVGTANAAPVWLYNGKLTNLTNADLKL